MSRIRVLTRLGVLPLVVVLVAASWCEAQNRQRGGSRFQGRGFSRGGSIGKSTLLRVEKVRKELKITDAQKTKLDEIASASRSGRPSFDFRALRDLSEEERNKKFAELRLEREKRTKETDKKLEAVLNSDQVARLDEIVLQLRGIRALTDDKVTEDLGLTSTQKTKIKGVFDAERKKQEELRGSRGSTNFRDLSSEEREKLIAEFRERREKQEKEREKLRKETETNALAVLTTEQTELFELMKGEKFEIDRRELFQGFGRGSRGGDRGRGGRPGGGNRPARPSRPTGT